MGSAAQQRERITAKGNHRQQLSAILAALAMSTGACAPMVTNRTDTTHSARLALLNRSLQPGNPALMTPPDAWAAIIEALTLQNPTHTIFPPRQLISVLTRLQTAALLAQTLQPAPTPFDHRPLREFIQPSRGENPYYESYREARAALTTEDRHLLLDTMENIYRDNSLVLADAVRILCACEDIVPESASDAALNEHPQVWWDHQIDLDRYQITVEERNHLITYLKPQLDGISSGISDPASRIDQLRRGRITRGVVKDLFDIAIMTMRYQGRIHYGSDNSFHPNYRVREFRDYNSFTHLDTALVIKLTRMMIDEHVY